MWIGLGWAEMDWAILDFVGFDVNELTFIGLAWIGADGKGLT